jgi:hypothetical protein
MGPPAGLLPQDAKAGYHCDGCGVQDPAYRCGSRACDFDLCAACYGGFVGRAEMLQAEYGFRCGRECARCVRERADALNLCTDFVVEQQQQQQQQHASSQPTHKSKPGGSRVMSAGEFVVKYACDGAGCSGMRVPSSRYHGMLICNLCHELRSVKSLDAQIVK